MKPDEVTRILKESIAEEMGIAISEIEMDDTFFDLGLDSVTCIFVMDRVEKKLDITLNPVAFWDHPTVEAFSAHIEKVLQGAG